MKTEMTTYRKMIVSIIMSNFILVIGQLGSYFE